MIIDKMVYNGLNFCSSDAYFIRLKNHKDYYIHQDRKTHFKLKKNVFKASIFRKKDAEELIILLENSYLETIPILDIITPDYSFN